MRQSGERRRRFQIGGRMADRLHIAFARPDQVRFGRAQGRTAHRQPRIRLRHVGARHIADFEAVARRFQVGFKHLHILAVQGDDRDIQRDIEISGDDLRKHVGFGAAQAGLPLRHPGLGGIDRAAHPATHIQRHIERSVRLERVARIEIIRAVGELFDGMRIDHRALQAG